MRTLVLALLCMSSLVWATDVTTLPPKVQVDATTSIAPKAVAQSSGNATQTSASVVTTTTTGAPSSPAPSQASSQQTSAAQTTQAPRAVADNVRIIKSKSDERFYRRVTLDNGLAVMLVSDPKTTKAAAAMDVGVGYWNDPEDISGLAHFLEHMLFLGTARFPNEDAYSGFLSAHGGGSNAFTSMQNTNFYFDVQPNSLVEALDRFSRFFVEPLFTESSTGREKEAVESEHSKNLQSDSWRNFQLIQSLSNPTHPFHKFGTGSKETLDVDAAKLRQALIAYWTEHYVAPNMRLVIVGRESLKELEALAVKYFSDVPKAPNALAVPRPYPIQDTSKQVFLSDRTGSVVFSKTVKDVRQLVLLWTIPPQTADYRSKSLDFISTLLGNEGEGSLLDYLKRRGWVTSLVAGPDLSTSQFDLFQISVDLTKDGMVPGVISQIITAVFSFIRLLEQKGIEKWRWDEMARISSISFALKNKEQAQSYASALASEMRKYAAADLLVANYMYSSWEPQKIADLLGMLVPKNMLVMISSQKPTQTLTQKERWYGTEYSVAPIDSSMLVQWTEARTGASATPDPELARLQLPTQNIYIPTSLDIKAAPAVAHKHPLIIKDVVDAKSATHGSMRIWHKQDTVFRRPRGNVICKWWSSNLYSTPHDVVLSGLYTKLVRDFLSKRMYPASVAGFDFAFSSDVDGFNLHLSGYDSGLLRFTHEVTQFLNLVDPALPERKGQKGFLPDKDRFKMIKEELIQSYSNFMYGQPHIHAAYSMSLLLEQPHWHISQYMSAIQGIELEDVIAWSRGVWQDVALECLVHGNVMQSEALSLVEEVVNNVDYRSNTVAVRTISGQMQRVAKLEGAYAFTRTAPNPKDANSAVYTYFQDGPGNLYADIMVQLLSNVMEKPAFHQLRTVEQLGYIVWSGADVREGVNGFRVIVQSPTYTGAHVASRIDSFVTQLRGKIQNMTAGEFDTFRRSLITVKLQKPRTMVEESSRFWYEISSQQYKFHRRMHEIRRLRTVTLDNFQKYFDRVVQWGGVSRKITVQINSAITPPPIAPKTEGPATTAAPSTTTVAPSTTATTAAPALVTTSTAGPMANDVPSKPPTPNAATVLGQTADGNNIVLSKVPTPQKLIPVPQTEAAPTPVTLLEMSMQDLGLQSDVATRQLLSLSTGVKAVVREDPRRLIRAKAVQPQTQAQAASSTCYTAACTQAMLHLNQLLGTSVAGDGEADLNAEAVVLQTAKELRERSRPKSRLRRADDAPADATDTAPTATGPAADKVQQQPAAPTADKTQQTTAPATPTADKTQQSTAAPVADKVQQTTAPTADKTQQSTAAPTADKTQQSTAAPTADKTQQTQATPLPTRPAQQTQATTTTTAAPSTTSAAQTQSTTDAPTTSSDAPAAGQQQQQQQSEEKEHKAEASQLQQQLPPVDNSKEDQSVAATDLAGLFQSTSQQSQTPPNLTPTSQMAVDVTQRAGETWKDLPLGRSQTPQQVQARTSDKENHEALLKYEWGAFRPPFVAPDLQQQKGSTQSSPQQQQQSTTAAPQTVQQQQSTAAPQTVQQQQSTAAPQTQQQQQQQSTTAAPADSHDPHTDSQSQSSTSAPDTSPTSLLAAARAASEAAARANTAADRANAAADRAEKVQPSQHSAAWDYTQHGRDWTGTCQSTLHQSPINIDTTHPQVEPTSSSGDPRFFGLQFNYKPSAAVVRNNGNYLSVDGNDLGLLHFSLDDMDYRVLEVQFHAPSEHAVNNRRSDLEMQVVHQRVDASGNDEILITSYLFNVGPAHSPFLKSLDVTSPPVASTASPLRNLLNLGRVSSATEAGGWYAYRGSLTAPPCAGPARWFVMRTMLSLSAEQLQVMSSLFPLGSYRALQPLRNRAVFEFDRTTGVQRLASATTPAPVTTQAPQTQQGQGQSQSSQTQQQQQTKVQQTGANDFKADGCKTGARQSPINIDSTTALRPNPALPVSVSRMSLKFSYEVSLTPATLGLDSRSLVLDGIGLGNVDNAADGATYPVVRIHVRVPAEHMIDGKRAAAEINVVHRRLDATGNDGLLVTVFLLETSASAADNAFLQTLFSSVSHLPTTASELVESRGVDLSQLSAAYEGAWYGYKGSLIGASCAEPVIYRVMTTPLSVSAAQLNTIAKAVGVVTPRDPQPLNGRNVYFYDHRELGYTVAAPSNVNLGQQQAVQVAVSQSPQTLDWSYKRQRDWPLSCQGSQQSPINLYTTNMLPPSGTRDEPNPWSLAFSYAPANGVVINNSGRGVDYLVPQGALGSITNGFNGAVYDVIGLALHSPSEHAFDNKRADIELQVVHQQRGAKNRLVSSYLFNVGAESSNLLSALQVERVPAVGTTATLDGAVDLRALMPAQSAGWFSYEGSDTQPPCMQHVQWRVMKTMLSCSAAEKDALIKAAGTNARDLQPWNGRSVAFYETKAGFSVAQEGTFSLLQIAESAPAAPAVPAPLQLSSMAAMARNEGATISMEAQQRQQELMSEQRAAAALETAPVAMSWEQSALPPNHNTQSEEQEEEEEEEAERDDPTTAATVVESAPSDLPAPSLPDTESIVLTVPSEPKPQQVVTAAPAVITQTSVTSATQVNVQVQQPPSPPPVPQISKTIPIPVQEATPVPVQASAGSPQGGSTQTSGTPVANTQSTDTVDVARPPAQPQVVQVPVTPAVPSAPQQQSASSTTAAPASGATQSTSAPNSQTQSTAAATTVVPAPTAVPSPVQRAPQLPNIGSPTGQNLTQINEATPAPKPPTTGVVVPAPVVSVQAPAPGTGYISTVPPRMLVTDAPATTGAPTTVPPTTAAATSTVAPTKAPVPSHEYLAETCNKSGPPRVHDIEVLTVETIERFKNGLCLFPKRAVGPVTSLFAPGVKEEQ